MNNDAIDELKNEGVEVLGPVPPEHASILTPEALRFVADLDRAFEGTRQDLLRKRRLRQQEILRNDETGGNSDASIRAHDRWQLRRAEMIGRGARPTLVGRTVTEHTAAAPPASAVPVAIERVATPRTDRPHGRRFGTLVHAVPPAYACEALDVDAA